MSRRNRDVLASTKVTETTLSRKVKRKSHKPKELDSTPRRAKQVAAISELRGAVRPRLTQGAVEATDLTVDAILATALTSNVDARFLAPIPSRNDLSALA
jgi:hypothetical protein